GQLLAGRWPRRLPGRSLVVLLIVTVVYGLWPYVTLWCLNQAVIENDQAAIVALVDVDAIRTEIARALNKEQSSAIDDLSDPFITWLERGLRRHGTTMLDELVTLDWVRERLLVQAVPGQGFVPAVSYAFFRGPWDFRVRIGEEDTQPVALRLTYVGFGWRVTMLSP
ncbi:MAG: DUF2939 domain-containing protein, partial [Thiocapsa sp.]